MSRRDQWMLRMGATLSGVAVCGAVAVTTACGSGHENAGVGGSSAAPATGGTAGDGGSASAASGGSGAGKAGSSSGATGGTDSGTGGGNVGEGGSGGDAGAPVIAGDGTELDPGADGPGYDGVKLTITDLVRPITGCSAFEPTNGTLDLTLDATAPSAIVRVTSGVVSVNGKACTTADGKTTAKADLVTSVTVTGGAEDNFVFVDGAGAFGDELLTGGNGFALELGGGLDVVVALGTDGSDDVRLGMDGDALAIDFTGDLVPDIHALDAEQVVVSTGPMPDTVFADGVDLELSPVTLPIELHGGGANDLLLGGAGSDKLNGGIGNDTLLAGRDPGGADLFVGGDGEDLVDYAGRTAPVNVTLASGADDGAADEHDEVDASVENARGGDGDDHIVGSSSNNKLWGGPGSDVLIGGDGDDFLYGGEGQDQLEGQEGNDFLYGEGGDDQVNGGNGDDLLDGYPGTNVLDGGSGDGDVCVPTKADSATACEL